MYALKENVICIMYSGIENDIRSWKTLKEIYKSVILMQHYQLTRNYWCKGQITTMKLRCIAFSMTMKKSGTR